MVILSKDKTKCAEYNRLSVQKNIGGGKEKKFALVGTVNSIQDTLDTYPTQEEAVAQLEKIFAAYQNGVKTYTL